MWIFLWLKGIILHSDKGIMPFAVVPEMGCTGHFCILSLQHQSKTWLNPEIASPWFYLSSYKAPKWILRQSLCSSITFIYDLVYGIYNFDNINIFLAFEFHRALKSVCFLHYCPVWLSKTLFCVCINKKKTFFSSCSMKDYLSKQWFNQAVPIHSVMFQTKKICSPGTV